MKTRISRIFLEFVENEKTGGLVLVFGTLVSIAVANSALGSHYAQFWHYCLDLSLPGLVMKHTIAGWVNDGLMTVFFLLVGLEIEREFYKGELSGIKNALLPVIAALGGMLVPALIHFSLNGGAPTQSGFGIPMATDIAFSLGALSLLGKRVPVSLKVVLTALAIIDDLGSVLVIAFFYVRDFSFPSLMCALGIFFGLVMLNRLKVNNIPVYLIAGTIMWVFMLKSGVHATIAGVLLAFAIPFRTGDRFSPSYKIQRFLDKPVPLIILPIFVLANTGIVFSSGWYLNLIDHNTLGIFAGLVLGKPVGIASFSLVSVRTGLCRLPKDLAWRHMVGLGILGGIGFTMSIFITNLAFINIRLVQNSKVAILAASVVASITGVLVLFGKGRAIPSKRHDRRSHLKCFM
ncbi:MAG: Na(+)/H(+) antiporter NhaA [Syntrophorhabdus sp. PtaU1.Bin002]|nr:MAG: Na(+)/H(+) antiporter NhaA [Syntrophorhabdus sp. PtaU1.Bin002]